MGRRIIFRDDREPGLEILIDKAGSLKAIAEVLGLTRPAISRWRRVPIEHAIYLEEEFGVPRWELRPDVYPPPDEDRQRQRKLRKVLHEAAA
jgi:hypothetical protein